MCDVAHSFLNSFLKATVVVKTQQGGFSVLHCVAVYCNVLQFVLVCCSVLQCVAVCCNV